MTEQCPGDQLALLFFVLLFLHASFLESSNASYYSAPYQFCCCEALEKNLLDLGKFCLEL